VSKRLLAFLLAVFFYFVWRSEVVMASTANKNATTANKTVKSAIKKRKTEKITKTANISQFFFYNCIKSTKMVCKLM